MKIFGPRLAVYSFLPSLINSKLIAHSSYTSIKPKRILCFNLSDASKAALCAIYPSAEVKSLYYTDLLDSRFPIMDGSVDLLIANITVTNHFNLRFLLADANRILREDDLFIFATYDFAGKVFLERYAKELINKTILYESEAIAELKRLDSLKYMTFRETLVALNEQDQRLDCHIFVVSHEEVTSLVNHLAPEEAETNANAPNVSEKGIEAAEMSADGQDLPIEAIRMDDPEEDKEAEWAPQGEEESERVCEPGEREASDTITEEFLEKDNLAGCSDPEAISLNEADELERRELPLAEPLGEEVDETEAPSQEGAALDREEGDKSDPPDPLSNDGEVNEDEILENDEDGNREDDLEDDIDAGEGGQLEDDAYDGNRTEEETETETEEEDELEGEGELEEEDPSPDPSTQEQEPQDQTAETSDIEKPDEASEEVIRSMPRKR